MSFGGNFNNQQWQNNSGIDVNQIAIASTLIAAALKTAQNVPPNINMGQNQNFGGPGYSNMGPPQQIPPQMQHQMSPQMQQQQSAFFQGRGGGVEAPWARGHERPNGFNPMMGRQGHEGFNQMMDMSDGFNQPMNSGPPQNFQNRLGSMNRQNPQGYQQQNFRTNQKFQNRSNPPKVSTSTAVKKPEPKKVQPPAAKLSTVKKVESEPSKATVKKPSNDGAKKLENADETVTSSDEKAKPVSKVEPAKPELKKKVPIKAPTSPYDGLPLDLLKCTICELMSWTPSAFERHLQSQMHTDLQTHLAEQHWKYILLLRQRVTFLEEQKRMKKGMKRGRQLESNAESNFCKICDQQIEGSLSLHRGSGSHILLREFLHPKCKVCNKEFKERPQYQNHIFSPGHLQNLFKEGVVKAQPQEIVEYLWLGGSKDDKPSSNAKPKSELEKKAEEESKEICDEKITQFKIPEFEEGKLVGASFLKNVNGYFCRLCKKFVHSDIEIHCKTEQHFDKFHEAIILKKAEAENLLELKRSLSEEDFEEESSNKKKKPKIDKSDNKDESEQTKNDESKIDTEKSMIDDDNGKINDEKETTEATEATDETTNGTQK